MIGTPSVGAVALDVAVDRGRRPGRRGPRGGGGTRQWPGRDGTVVRVPTCGRLACVSRNGEGVTSLDDVVDAVVPLVASANAAALTQYSSAIADTASPDSTRYVSTGFDRSGRSRFGARDGSRVRAVRRSRRYCIPPTITTRHAALIERKRNRALRADTATLPIGSPVRPVTPPRRTAPWPLW